jgi:hypothetical protein
MDGRLAAIRARIQLVRAVDRAVPEIDVPIGSTASALRELEVRVETALVEWAVRVAPRIAIDGPEDPTELEAIAEVFESMASRNAPEHMRTLGYLHLREERWADAEAAFVAAARASQSAANTLGETAARLHLDRARLALVRGQNPDAIREGEAGLARSGVWYSTGDDLRATLERAYAASGRREEAIAVLDRRAAECEFSFDLHHRLARERLARNDIDRAGAALERAARLENILGEPAPIEQRIAASFDPIIAELRAAGRRVDADALVARVEIILSAN